MDAPTYPVLPLKDTVVYPEIVHHLAVGRRKSLAALTAGAEKDRELIVVAQKHSDIQDPALDDLHKIGTIVKISRVEKHDQGAQVVVHGLRRVRLEQPSENTDYLAVTFTELPPMTLANLGDDAPAVDALLRENQQAAHVHVLPVKSTVPARATKSPGGICVVALATEERARRGFIRNRDPKKALLRNRRSIR